ncbi:two-component sensor histidine kinase [Paenibacillus agaridevorans]|uniref:histidine kinase n=1 Tax=Paenibacillus agaridevorans TaxID=171404 RepID=A0A2R5EVX0_9BACL|nr:sensor histidine kinase [Paenibacillus agaridevorans]GBG09188.1 two-component sensor histidine kinase [Paenibacillus agaridevorans]
MIRRSMHKLRSSIRAKLLLTLVLIAALPLTAIGVILYSSTVRSSEEQTIRNRQQEMRMLGVQLAAFVERIERYTRAIYTGEVQALLNEGPPEDLVRYKRWESELFQRFDEWYGYMNIQTPVNNVVWVSADGRIVSKERNIEPYNSWIKQPWFDNVMAQGGQAVVAGPFRRLEPYGQPDRLPYAVVIGRKINNTLSTAPLGAVLVELNLSTIAALMAETDTSNVLVLDNANRIVYSSDLDEIGSNWLLSTDWDNLSGKRIHWKGEEMFVNQTWLSGIGWRAVSLDPVKKLHTYADSFRNTTIQVGLVALAFAVLLAVLVARRVSHPLRELKERMKQLQSGQFPPAVEVHSTDEVGQLAHGFNRMNERIENLIKDVYHSELMRKQAQLQALHSQINPHFLYNTLDAMSALAIIERVPVLSQMSVMLADMFRYSISSGESLVSLRDEIEQVRRYFEINQIRYDYRFHLHISVPDSLMATPIPKLTLQPLAENAIYHGLELRPDDNGFLAVTAYVADEFIRIEVFDNGIGMSPETLEALHAKLAMAAKHPDAEHIGLANVQQRLQLHYGTTHDIEVESKEGAGTNIVLKLPLPNE